MPRNWGKKTIVTEHKIWLRFFSQPREKKIAMGDFLSIVQVNEAFQFFRKDKFPLFFFFI